MNKLKVKNQQVFNNSLNQFMDEQILVEPALVSIPWLTKIFGCWHKNMGLPFTRGRQTYRTCMVCGASQQFDVKLWKNSGHFYYNPILALYDLPMEKTYKTSQFVSSFEIERWAEDGGQNYELSEKK